jgi:uncharacterized protein
MLAVAGVAWCAFRGRPDVLHHPEPWIELGTLASSGASLVLGAVLALATLALTRALVRRMPWARNLHVEFRRLIGPLSPFVIAALALGSSLGEELFFRAALQPSIGWIASSLVFGLLHIGPNRRFLVWTAWAVVMGFLLGGIYAATGSLLGPLLAHAWINYQNLHFISSHDPRDRGERIGEVAPRLVGRPRRL